MLLFGQTLPAAAAPGKRVALVIGNSAYRHASELPNPRNDAADMSLALRSLGIEVIEGLDLTKQDMEAKLRAFAETLEGADLGFFSTPATGCRYPARTISSP